MLSTTMTFVGVASPLVQNWKKALAAVAMGQL
jgi:hypothetical protein